MRLTCYHRTDDPALSAFAEGARGLGHRVRITAAKYWKPGEVDATAEAVVVVGLHGAARALRDLYAARGVPVWVMDLPRLRDVGYVAGFTLNSLHWLPAEGRPPRKTAGVLRTRTPSRLLVVGQLPDDAAHGLDVHAMQDWARETVAALRARTALPIHYRPHPLAAGSASVGADAGCPAPDIRTALADVAVLVTYNSTCGWDALDAGVPLVATAPPDAVGYADYATLGLPEALDIPALPAARRKDALARAAATCWTLDELRDGIAARAMLGAA